MISRITKSVVVSSVACGLGSFLWGATAFAQEATVDLETQSTSSVFQFPPTTADEIVDAAQITRKLDRPGDSRTFLRQLIEKAGSPELSDLRVNRGLAIFIEFNTDPRLQPEARELLKTMQDALPQRSAEELTSFVQQLAKNDSAGKKAELELLAAGESSVSVLLAADPSSPSGIAAQQLLESYARDFRFELLRQLATSDPATQIRILRLLEGTSDPTLAIRLLRYQHAGSDKSVQSAAGDAIQTLSKGRLHTDSAEQALVILLEAAESRLRQNGGQAILVSATDPSADPIRPELILQAESLIDDALVISKVDGRASRLKLVTQLASTNPQLSAEPTVAAALPEGELLELLQLSLRLEVPIASIECLRALSRLNSASVDNATAGRVLYQSLESPDARVRALAAILVRRGWPVTRKFAVQRTLTAAASAPVKPEAVVVSPNAERQLLIGHLLQDAGYAVRVAESGPDGFDLAASQLNCDLFVLDVTTTTWTVDSTMANLRADLRTRNTPVVVFGDPLAQQRATALDDRYGRVWFVAEPLGERTLATQLQSMNLPAPVMSAEDRQYVQERSR